jgi:hypothetical protein
MRLCRTNPVRPGRTRYSLNWTMHRLLRCSSWLEVQPIGSGMRWFTIDRLTSKHPSRNGAAAPGSPREFDHDQRDVICGFFMALKGRQLVDDF